MPCSRQEANGEAGLPWIARGSAGIPNVISPQVTVAAVPPFQCFEAATRVVGEAPVRTVDRSFGSLCPLQPESMPGATVSVFADARGRLTLAQIAPRFLGAYGGGSRSRRAVTFGDTWCRASWLVLSADVGRPSAAPRASRRGCLAWQPCRVRSPGGFPSPAEACHPGRGTGTA